MIIHAIIWLFVYYPQNIKFVLKQDLALYEMRLGYTGIYCSFMSLMFWFLIVVFDCDSCVNYYIYFITLSLSIDCSLFIYNIIYPLIFVQNIKFTNIAIVWLPKINKDGFQ